MENALISVNEAAQQIGVSRETIKNWGKRGILSLTYVGKHACVSKKSVDDIKGAAPELVKQMQALETLQEELETQANLCLEEIREFRLEKVLRKESAQRVVLYMEIFASLVDLIYEGRYDEREYKAVMMFMKGTSIDEIAEKLNCSKQVVLNNIRKCNEVLFNLQPYVRLQEENREYARRLKLLEKDREILQAMLEVCRNDETGVMRWIEKDSFELYLTPITEMQFSTRTRSALMSSYLDCLGDLVHYGNRLSNLRGLGTQSLHEVEEIVATQYHLKLGTRIPGWESIKRAFYGEKNDNVVYEKLFEMDDEAKEYMETALAELPEERVQTVRGLLQGMYSTGEACKKELEQYKSVCEGLRKQMKMMEKRLEHKDFYLSPAYDEVKELFTRLEARGAREAREVTPEGEVKPAVNAMGLLDCIFSQEAVQAESRQMQADWVKIRNLEKDIHHLEVKMQRKDKSREIYNAQRREMDKKYQEELSDERKEGIVREEKLQMEIERWKKLNEEKTNELVREREMSKVRERVLEKELELLRQREAEWESFKDGKQASCDKVSLLKKELEWEKKVNEETLKHYVLQVETNKKRAEVLENELKHFKELLDSQGKDRIEKEEHYVEKERMYAEREKNLEKRERELLRMEQQDYDNFWEVLMHYENQVNEFNSRSWYQKLWQKMKKFSNAKKHLLMEEGK